MNLVCSGATIFGLKLKSKDAVAEVRGVGSSTEEPPEENVLPDGGVEGVEFEAVGIDGEDERRAWEGVGLSDWQ